MALLDETIQIGLTLVDKILLAKPWTAEGTPYWNNLKRGLCFFAAEYASKTPKVAELFCKHILKDGEAEETALSKEFSEQSPIMKDLLSKAIEQRKVKTQEEATDAAVAAETDQNKAEKPSYEDAAINNELSNGGKSESKSAKDIEAVKASDKEEEEEQTPADKSQSLKEEAKE